MTLLQPEPSLWCANCGSSDIRLRQTAWVHAVDSAIIDWDDTDESECWCPSCGDMHLTEDDPEIAASIRAATAWERSQTSTNAPGSTISPDPDPTPTTPPTDPDLPPSP